MPPRSPRDEAFVKGSYLGDAGNGEVEQRVADLPLSARERGFPQNCCETIEARAEAEGRNPADVVLELLTEAIYKQLRERQGGTS